MRKVLLTALALLPLVACEMPGPVISKELAGITGKPIKAAFGRLGYPNNQGEIAGEKFYVWSTANTAWMPSVSTTTGTGMVGGTSFSYNQSSIGDGETITLQCRVRIFVDKHELITHFDMGGNNGGCAQYAHMLDHSYNF